jgi:sugar lactone lactonase YvrE
MRIPVGTVPALLLMSFSAFAQQYTISTVAGGAPPPNSGNAQSVPLGGLGAVASDPSGNIYFIASNSVFMDQNNALMRVAGTSRIGYSGDNAAATAAQLNSPGGIAIDGAGNLYIADSGNNRIRKVVLSSGVISTIAGTGTASYTGDNGPASNATLNNPQGLALDSAGNLYIADTNNNVIRKIVFATGAITTVAGNGIQGVAGDGQIATTARLNSPTGITVDSLFNIYIADSGNHRIREVVQIGNPLQPGPISTIAGIGVAGFSGDNGSAISALFNTPTGVAIDSAGNLYVNDSLNVRVRKITNAPNCSVNSSSCIITTVANVGLQKPVGIAVTPNGDLFVSDSAMARVLRYSAPVGPASSITPIAGSGDAYYLGDTAAATSAQLVQPQGLAVDINGIYIADRGEMRVRKINSQGVINTLPGTAGLGAAGVAVDSSGNFYIADALNHQVLKIDAAGNRLLIAGNQQAGFNGDGLNAQLIQLNQPSGVAVDGVGNVYIADTNNNRVRKVSFASGSTIGSITTIAGTGAPGFSGENVPSNNAQLNQPTGVAVDSSGNIYIADTGNNRIRKINTAGIITTVAGNGSNTYSGDGGQATSAGIVSPHGVAVGPAGSIYITDASGRVRKVSSGVIITIAGNGTLGYSGDGGPATSAQLSLPWGITVDGSGYVYVSDVNEQAIRLLAPQASSVPVIQTTSLAAGTVGTPYAQALSAAGGSAPYTWSITSGSLPPGLTFSPTGSITGSPTVSGSFLVQVQVTDSFLVTSQPVIITISVNPSAPGGLSIVTSPVLVPGAVGVAYSQQLNATLGTQPYNWTLTSGALPTGLSLFPNGLIAGTPVSPGTSNFTIRVNDNTGAVVTQNFTLTILSPGTLTRTGALGHIAAGGTWTTKVYLTNISTGPLALNLVFHGDDGNLLTLPISVTQQGTTQQFSTSSFNGAMNANSTLIVEMGAQLPNTVTGWIDVLSSGTPASMAGFAIFRTVSSTVTSEGTTPLQTTFGSKLIVPFDDTGSFVTGFAVSNLSAAPATVTVTVIDISGNQLGTCSLSLGANGHRSDLFPNTCAVSANQQGIVQFVSSGGGLAGVGLRASTTSGTFTSVPVVLP